jgi:hypothetical protein
MPRFLHCRSFGPPNHLGNKCSWANGFLMLSVPSSDWVSLAGEGLRCSHGRRQALSGRAAARWGVLLRRRETTLAVAYDFAGLGSSESIGRVIEIATLDDLGLENSIARCRVLIAAATAASRLLEVGELEARLAVLEAAVGREQGKDGGPVFPAETEQ